VLFVIYISFPSLPTNKYKEKEDFCKTEKPFGIMKRPWS